MIFAIGLTTSTCAALIHAAYVRIMGPRSFFFGLLVIEALVLATETVLLLIADHWIGLFEWTVASALSLSLIAVYLLCFVGVAHDSPTLAFINAIGDFGTRGMPMEAIPQFIEQHPFVTKRLDAMLEAGLIKSDGRRIVVGAKTAGILRLALQYQRLTGSGRASG